MAEFRLRSDYKPTGDQPAAIAQLIEGLEQKLNHQTLLGVTGSGKSVIGSSKIIIEHLGESYYLSINQLDKAFPEELPAMENATQVVYLQPGTTTVSFDRLSGEIAKSSVLEISRHRYSKDLYTVMTSCGRSNQFTDSHNMFVLRDGELLLLPSKSLKGGDWLPVPDSLPKQQNLGIEFLDLREWLPEDTFFVAMAQPEKRGLKALALSTRKTWAISKGRERIAWIDYKRLNVTVAFAETDRVSYTKHKAALPVIFHTSRLIWRFLGLYIAEGHSAGKYITLSTADDSIVSEFAKGTECLGLKLSKRAKPYDYQVSGRAISMLMEMWCGSLANNKHLPAFWPQCNDKQLGEFLSGVFAGDGWVEPNCVCLASSSQELIHDMQFALLRFGIHARVRYKGVMYQGKRRASWVLSIYGQHDLSCFQKFIGFGLDRKDKSLQNLLNITRISNTNVDVFPLNGGYFRALCKKYGLYQRDIAEVAGTTRSTISLYMDEKRLPARNKARLILVLLLKRALALKDVSNAQQLEHLLALTNLFWSPIKNIERKSSHDEVVYDLSVLGRQTFLAGMGGYFVHNTFTMANIIQSQQKPTLVLSHNKTLAAQLYNEFRMFFPDNAVHYFVSYFDYYQPEAYMPRTDTYIEKDSAINEEIERLRHAATASLLSRRDCIIVASVSCIYGIGSVEDYAGMTIKLKTGERLLRDKFLRRLTDIQYRRNDMDFHRSTFRVRGDVVDVYPIGEETAYRVEFFGDEVERITQINPLTGEIEKSLTSLSIFPGSHYVTPEEKLKGALGKIRNETDQRLAYFKKEGKLLEAQRLEQRVKFDLEMLEQTGFVKGIENYSRYLTNREEGEQPATLMDYFPDDYLMFIDESHMSIPQVRGMYNGDRARKEVLVEHGFRLPSALDNRPLTFTEFERHLNQTIYVSATPAEYELSRSPEPVQQLIRPTGLLDPIIQVRPTTGQIDDLINEIRETVAKGQRVLVTTLTKRMAEDLSEYLKELNIKVTYLHSEIDTLERTDVLRDLRLGVYDVLVGINLLREGLDLPEVSLVAIMDADKEGFLRSEQALIQTVGRAARHREGRVVMYADRVTGSMQRTMDETNRRRALQEQYNKEHGITPISISREIGEFLPRTAKEEKPKLDLRKIPKDEYKHLIHDLTSQMDLAAANLEFEKAADLRDLIAEIKAKL